MEIGQILKEKRNEYQLTQEQLAEKIFVTNKTISNWETEKTIPDIESLIRLANLFDLSLDNLLLEESDIVKDIKQKEIAFNIQKSYIFGAQLTNSLLFLFLFLPAISEYFFISSSMYIPLFLIVCSNVYTILVLEKEVKKFEGTNLEVSKFTKISKVYFIIGIIICLFSLGSKYLF